MKSEKTACERLELQFIWVAQTARLASASDELQRLLERRRRVAPSRPSITTVPSAGGAVLAQPERAAAADVEQASSFSW